VPDTPATEAKPKLRYYGESNDSNPAFKIPALQAVMHKLFCRWVRLNYHIRDFAVAIEDEAHLLYFDYLAAGKPVFEEKAELPEEKKALAACPPVPVKTAATEPPKRLYVDNGDVNLEVDVSGMRTALAPFFLYGLLANWFPRDFIALAKDLASSTLYDYQISSSMGGLGGCKTAEEFLAVFD
jgi:hypothetical protein